ncbi:MAG: hypothetical protein ACNI3A_00515 [Desulfovibrio sp.]|uniref:hypothetical protein n=1 Tax=Desulfovibrio sp. 7SRBS1 TaxID=3378064 RepID=UPI003B415FC0
MPAVIGTEELEREVLAEARPVLLACLAPGEEFGAQLELLSCVSEDYGSKIKVCIADSGFPRAIRRKWRIKGFPSFILLLSGVVRGTLEGVPAKEHLDDCIAACLC